MRTLSPMFVVIMLIVLVLVIGGGVTSFFGSKLQKADMSGPQVSITAAMRACKKDADCMMVNAACNGCCGENAISRAQEKPFNIAFGRLCQGTRIAICDCGFGPRTPVCRNGGCLLEAAPPVQP